MEKSPDFMCGCHTSFPSSCNLQCIFAENPHFLLSPVCGAVVVALCYIKLDDEDDNNDDDVVLPSSDRKQELREKEKCSSDSTQADILVSGVTQHEEVLFSFLV